MIQQEILDWARNKCQGRSVYAIPKNGLIIALMARLNLVDSPDDADIIFDDLSDSGHTLEEYIGKKEIVVVYVKPHTPNKDKMAYFQEASGWIEFPWEGENSMEDNITRVIELIGENPNREGLVKTPTRVRKAYEKIFEGYKKDPSEFMTVFQNESSIDQIVGLSNIEFYSTCEHHMLPFFGKAHIYYIPDKKIVGISKLARILDMFARRLQNQERVAKQVADLIEETLQPKGVAVVIEARHLCMMARGVEKQMSVMRTSDLRGAFREKHETRDELFQLIGKE